MNDTDNVSVGRQAGKGPPLLLATAIVALAAGCSVKKMAINMVGDALAESGSTFASDDDPELVRDAVPFSLKLMESLLAETPDHEGLLYAASSGFTQYAYAFVQMDADRLEDEDFEAAEAMRERAKRLYLRARGYGLRGLEARYPGLTEGLESHAAGAIEATGRRDVNLLYWTAASWAAAIALSKDDPHMVAEIPRMEALIDRALELDEGYDDGAIHTFLITYEMSRQGAADPPAERSRRHFERAVELSRGRQASPFVAYAEAVCVQEQSVREFDELLERALAIDPDADVEYRLLNLIVQRRARWLLDHREDLFLLPDGA